MRLSEPAPTVAGVSRADETLLDLSLSRAAVDRSAHERGDARSRAAALADPRTQVLVLRDGLAPHRASPASQAGQGGPATSLVLRAPLPADEEADAWFLGRDGDRACLAVQAWGDDPPAGLEGEDVRWSSLRDIGAELDDVGSSLLTTATALAGWHERSAHCPRCGAETESVNGGWARRCPVDGSEHYPRTDPAVIMAVTDDRDRILLGTGLPWPDGRLSVLAGFVEAGETLEAAVAREVWEEVGLRVDGIRYRGNQPWPFPASLMLGFRAATTGTELRVDPAELRFAGWFSREELADGLRAGRYTLPHRLSIARALIEEWFGRPLEEAR